MFKISVIIPCYNVSLYIDRCLTSIVNQTIGIANLQIICVDDASTDDTWQCLQRWEQQYPDHIVLIHLDTNSRQGTCRNIAMEYVTAPWVTFIDADDWVEPDYCEIMYAYADGLDCDVVCCSFERDCSLVPIPLKNRSSGIRYLAIDTIEKRKIFLTNQSMGGNATTKLIRTKLLIDYQIYFADSIAYEDHLWTSLIHMYTKSTLILEAKLYHYFLNSSSTVLTRNSDYHIDWITSMAIKWKEWKKRGLIDLFPAECEYDFLLSGYLGFMRTLILRYTNPPYSLYLLAREFTLTHVPNYKVNPYIMKEMSEFHQLLLSSLSIQMFKKDFELLAKNAKVYYSIHG